LPKKSDKSRVQAVDIALSVMSTLATSQGMSASELASKIGASAGLMSAILQKLVDRRFIFKDLLDLYWLGPQLHY
jgi:DNA-binding IclR family transcriptional regulator